MPEMFEYCGQRFRVYKRAHKTCDTVNPSPAGRRLTNAVHLELRCDGKAHGGCQTACLIFWKEAWLKPVNEATTGEESLPDDARRRDKQIDETRCTEEIVWKSTCTRDPQSKDGKRYFCQATELPDFTSASSMVGHEAIRRRLHVRQFDNGPSCHRVRVCQL